MYMYIYIERVVSGEALDAKTHLDGLQRRAPHRCVLKWHKVVMRCKKIRYQTREFRAKLHLKPDIGFQVQFNAEFPRQVMNCPMVFFFQ